jgi:outer membrane protein
LQFLNSIYIVKKNGQSSKISLTIKKAIYMKLFFSTLLAALAIFSTSSTVQAWDDCGSCEPSSCGSFSFLDNALNDVAVEARVAYFRPCSKKTKRIYGKGWADYQVELSKGFYNNWRGWIGVSGFEKKGRSIGDHDRTKLRLIPLTFGLKYLFNVSPCADLYVGAGATYNWLRIKDHSSFVHETHKKQKWGGVIQLGGYYSFAENLFADVFVDYVFQEFKFHSHSNDSSNYVGHHKVNLNGFKFGGGIGYRF